ncbi:NAD(P)-binding protein [Irpex rosettiformis]|uniref:NAD(P)-binding protein n=1 Tax=Irpex rosettiformis TaxID=378272 RepID=A0ACB8UA25_9APHY|nr:NAD(P)-binding protein [Irpex rosettiformis]
MAKTPILLFGATGYLGSSVLSRLLSHPGKDTFDITVLVRSIEKAKKLEAFGVKTVIGSVNDVPLVERLAEQAHVLFSIADSHDLNAANAYLTGLKKRHTKSGDVPILIHTSGTSVFMFDTSTKVYRDDDPDDLENSIPPTAFHRNVDLAIVQADNEGYLRSYIILPSAIWGIAKNPLVDAGIANPYSGGVKLLIRAALERGQACMVGDGQALLPSINVEEQADFFIILYDAIVSNPENIGHGRTGYFFGENGNFIWHDFAKAVGKALFKRGLSRSEDPTMFTTEEVIKYCGSEEYGVLFNVSCRAKAIQAKLLGWQPKLTAQDFLESLDAEVEAHLTQQA